MNHKEGYYASLERQRVGENTLRERFDKAKNDGSDAFDALENLYSDVGMKAFAAFNNCLEWLSCLGRGSASNNDRLDPGASTAIADGIRSVQSELASVSDRLTRLEATLAALEAGMRRIDKFTLEAFRNLQELEEEVRRAPLMTASVHAQVGDRGRLPKEEAARLALEAGFRMRAEGRRMTLASVAREAGLKYGQIVYAFGNKDNFVQALDDMGSRDNGAPTGKEVNYEETATA